MGKTGCVIPYGKANKLCNGEMAVLTTVLIDLNEQKPSLHSLKGMHFSKFYLSFFFHLFHFLGVVAMFGEFIV